MTSYSIEHNQTPDEGSRCRIQYRGENAYFMHIFDKDGRLKAIDIYQSAPGKNSKETISGMQLVVSLVNLVIKLGGFRPLLEVLNKASLGHKTLAGIIHGQLASYLNTDKQP